MPETAERRGLGTPATRAAVIEKLVATGFAERRKAKKSVRLVPTEAGVSLITVLPEQLQSPLLTAEWEHRLKEIECGELGADTALTETFLRMGVDELSMNAKSILPVRKIIRSVNLSKPSAKNV